MSLGFKAFWHLSVCLSSQRQALPAGGTPVTKESFARWKAEQEKRRLEQVEEQRSAAAKKAGGASRGLDVLSGRDLFSFDPSLFVDVEGAADEADYEEDADWQEEVRRNQENIEAANAEAQKAAARSLRADDGDSGKEEEEEENLKLKRTEEQGAPPLNENLFLEGDIPVRQKLDGCFNTSSKAVPLGGG